LSPSIFWFSSADAILVNSCAAAIAASIFLTFGVLPKLSAIILWSLYLSFFNADSVFLRFQWDSLLIETGFLAILLLPWKTRFTVATSPPVPLEMVLLFQWLLFRLMFASGFVKLTSGDPHWRGLEALNYHFLTQPLPTPLAYYAAHLPHWALHASTASLFFIELFCPFLFFCRPAMRHFAGAATVLLQVLIILTGNYAFFNILTIGLCLFLFDDRLLLKLLSKKSQYVYETRRVQLGSPGRVSWAVAFFFFFAVSLGSIDMFGRLFGTEYIPPPLQKMSALSYPLHLINGYGLFAVMTTERKEIVIEGSEDGKRWRPYSFRYKPQDTHHAPPLVAPHQPRLDWQMWFAALGSARQNPWFITLLARISQGSAPVLALLKSNPFPDQPPQYLRALIYKYEFTTFSEKAISAAWWQRKLLGSYVPAIHFEKSESSQDKNPELPNR
jgi:hypothetical protein